MSHTASASAKETAAEMHFPKMHFAGESPEEKKTDAVCIWMQSPLKPKMSAAAGNDGALPSEKRPPVISKSPLPTAKSVPSAFEKRMKLTVRQTKKFAHIAAMERTDEKMHFENAPVYRPGRERGKSLFDGLFFLRAFSRPGRH